MNEPAISMHTNEIKAKQQLRDEIQKAMNQPCANTTQAPKIQVIPFGVSTLAEREKRQTKSQPMTIKENRDLQKKLHAVVIGNAIKKRAKK